MEIFEYLKVIINENIFDLIVINLPIFDIIGHSGNFRAAISVIESFDQILNNLINIFLPKKYTLVLTADHGNIERMVNPSTGEIDTAHTFNLVPFFVIDEDFKRSRTEAELKKIKKTPGGSLSNVAPTILELMGLEIPKEFNAKSLLGYL